MDICVKERTELLAYMSGAIEFIKVTLVNVAFV